IFCALAVLTRGPIGIVFPVGIIAAFITATRQWSRWRELHLFSSTAIFAAVAAPWHILAELRSPGFFWAYFVNENVNRALGTRQPHDYSALPLWLWWIAHLIWFFPWSLFLLLALKQFPSPRTWSRHLDAESQTRLFLFLWAGFIFLFFSIEGGSRMEYYSFGAWPAVALLLGLGLARSEQTLRRSVLVMQRTLAAVGVCLALATTWVVWNASHVPTTGDISIHLQTHYPAYDKASLAHVLDLTPQAFADLRVPALVAAFSIAIALIAAWLIRERGGRESASLMVSLGMVGFIFAAQLAYKKFEPNLSSRALAADINRCFRPGDQIALLGDIRVAPTIPFYTHRPVWLYDATESNLRFGSRYPDAPKVFLTDKDFPSLWNGSRRVFLIVRDNQQSELLDHLPLGSAWLLAQTGGKDLYVNQRPTDEMLLLSRNTLQGNTSPQNAPPNTASPARHSTRSSSGTLAGAAVRR